MLTNKFYSVIRPFFITRWSSELATNDMIDNYVNLCIQDIYNRHNWLFKKVNQNLTYTAYWEWYRKWETTYDIATLISAQDNNWNNLNPSFRRISEQTWYDPFTEVDINIWKNFIITRDNVDTLYVEYIREYTWFTYEAMKNEELPIPNKFIPALTLLVYDYASPLSYFEDDNTVPRYQIADKQLEYIKSNDSISESVYFAPDRSA